MDLITIDFNKSVRLSRSRDVNYKMRSFGLSPLAIQAIDRSQVLK